MLPAKLQRLVTAGAYVDPSAVKAIFDYAAERRRVDYILFPASAHMDKAAPSDEEVAKTYEAQSANFTVPPSVNVEFIRLDPAVMGDPASISDADLRAAYDARKNQFTEEEKIHARHILVRVPANAPEADVKKPKSRSRRLRPASAAARTSPKWPGAVRTARPSRAAISAGSPPVRWCPSSPRPRLP